ncbi:MAG: RNA 3'-terminal phosphate cyclase [Candidatus Micrarchaeia archaeon]
MIEIDGSYLEGGGQILRTSLSMSAILSEPFHIINIRANRPKKGLMPQHLHAVNAIAEICNASVEGNRIGSTELTFIPSSISAGEYSFDIGTAGSVVLLSQTIIPVLAYGDKRSKVYLKGGTDVMKSPTYNYFANVFIRNISNYGLKVSSKLEVPGFYPSGGGKIYVEIDSSKPKKYDFLDRGSLEGENVYIVLSNLPGHIVDREERYFYDISGHSFSVKKEIFKDAPSAGNSITLAAHFSNYSVGTDTLGIVGKPAEKVARDVFNQYIAEFNGAGTDTNMTDQLLIYTALSGSGSIKYNNLSAHSKTNIFTISKFTGLNPTINYDEKVISY